MSGVDDAVGMAATGVGLGIMIYGASVPLRAMSKMSSVGKKRRRKKSRRY